MKLSPYMLAVTMIIVCSLTEGHGAAQFVDPPSGEVIANFEGSENFTTIMCNVTGRSGTQATTRWGIENFRNVSTLQNILGSTEPTLFLISGDYVNGNININNRLTVLRLIPELDGAILYCGTGALPQQANFPIRIYRPPNLRDNLMYRIVENTLNVPVDLSQYPPPFPEPRNFTWTRNTVTLSNPTLTHSSITFPSVRRSDTGNYVVSATNFVLDNERVQIGSDTGSFTLDVIYGPTFAEPGPLQRYVLLGDPLSLVCGTGLDSNPQATITWTGPDGTMIIDNARYDLENGPYIVRLNFTRTILNDSGIWRCDVLVVSGQVIVSDRSLIPQNPSVIGAPIVRDIQLTIISTPSEPLTLLVDRIEATSIRICWESPLVADTSVTFYLITARNLNSTGDVTVVRNTTTNFTFFDVTGLLPGTTYELTVVAVSQGGDIFAVSQPSESVNATTGFTVPLLTCNDPLFSNGGITVRWFVNHTGGQELSQLLLCYTVQEGVTVSEPIMVAVPSVEMTEVNVPSLVAGVVYTFSVTAENEIGPSHILCGPTFLRIGKPFTPTFGDLISGPRDTDVMVEIKTVASGVEQGSQEPFQFNIAPVRNGMEEMPQMFMRNDYESGTLVMVTVEGLTAGETYTFSATAENRYGVSEVANSRFITIEERVTLSVSIPPSGAADNVGAVVGGAVGGIAALVLIVAVMVVVLLVFYRGKRRENGKIEAPIYDEPDNFLQSRAVKDSDIELKACPAYEKLQRDAHIELEQCPAYGELQRNPSRC